MNVAPLIVLFISSGFTMNLMLQCAIGIEGGAFAENFSKKLTIIKLIISFITVILLYFIFTVIISSILHGIFIYVILFPLSFLVYDALEYITFNYILKNLDRNNKTSISFLGGITAVSLFICLNTVNGLIETTALSLGFISGIILSILILKEIQKRAVLEAVPRFLRGKPIILISMGLLSLVFSSVSILFYRMLGG
jgi:electron transport complex protein RnfA